MAQRRGFAGRSRDDLYAEAESVSRMLAQLKGAGQGGPQNRRAPPRPYNAQWTPEPLREERYEPAYDRGSRYGPPQDRLGYNEPPDRSYPPRQRSQDWRRGPDERHQDRVQNQSWQRRPPPLRQGDPLTPHHLVEILADKNNFSLSLLNMLEEYNLEIKEVRHLVTRNGHLFLLQGEQVILSPRLLKLCAAHYSTEGCQARDRCGSLHICPKFVLSWCGDNESCVLGHRFHTNHNLTILKRLCLEYVRYPVLRQLLRGDEGKGQNRGQRQGKGQRQAAGPLGVCRDYNEGGCDQMHCSNLHVCLSFIVGLTKCSNRNCRLNHDLLNPVCCHLLRLHNLPVNEAPRDVAMAVLQANPSLKNMTLASPSPKLSYGKAKKQGPAKDKIHKTKSHSSKQLGTKKKHRSKDFPSDDEDDSDTESDSEESESSCSKGKKIHGKKSSKTPAMEVDDDSDSEDSHSSHSNDSKESESSHNKGKKIHGKKSSKTPAREEDDDSDSEDNNSSHSNDIKVPSGKGSQASKKGKNHGRRKQKGSEESITTDTDSEEDSKSSQSKNTKNKKQPKSDEHSLPGAASKQKATQPPKTPPRLLRTLWAHDLQGDVALPQICYYSVESMCRDEATGCSRLHSLHHFHWQICIDDQNNRWFNLRPEQAECIERAFCDPSIDGVDLPRLNPSKLEPAVRGLFLQLGRDVWHADFTTRTLTNSSKSKKLQLRRLCTQPVEGQTIKAASHLWYFQDINMKWVPYGQADTADRKDLVSSITSADIEKHYLQNPAVPLTFNNTKFTYILDLTNMKQTNQSTQVSRSVRRRPEAHLPEDETDEKAKMKADADLPKLWDIMQPEERSRTVTLAPTSDEYKKVVGLLGGSVGPRVIKVERIQNPHMWRILQNTIKDLTALYKDESKVDVRQLFHGTGPNAVASICAENFDWRLHGSSTGQARGRGTYFGTNADVSYRYCPADSQNLKYMFIARVAVGSMVVGNTSMVRPPTNPITNMPYESSVDNVANPSMIIKYCKQEYYPEYLLTLS